MKSKDAFEKQLRLRFDAASLFMDVFTNIFAGMEGGSDEIASITFYNREEDVLSIARRGAGDSALVLFASADNFVDCLFSLDAKIGASTWQKDKKAREKK